MDCGWNVLILDNEEWTLYEDAMNLYMEYCNTMFGDEEEVEEWDDPTYVITYASCVPARTIKGFMNEIKDDLESNNILETFNSEVQFLQVLFEFSDVDYLILINDEDFSTVPKDEDQKLWRTKLFTLYISIHDQIHKGEEIDEKARELTEQYFRYLTEEQRKIELNTICSNKKGKAKYGYLC